MSGDDVQLAIVGIGGLGRETAAWAFDAGAPLAGFLDEDVSTHGTQLGSLPVLGGLDWAVGRSQLGVVVAIEDPAQRDRLAGTLEAQGIGLARIVHPSAVLGPGVELGGGAIVGPGCVLTRDIDVGRGAVLSYGAKVGHDSRIGAAAFIGPNVGLAGTVTVGARAFIGIGASVIEAVTIGDDAVVGAGAVVLRDVKGGARVAGVPAEPIG